MSKKKSPAFQFYPDAWLSSTDIQLMSPAEEGAFIRLLCHAWLQPDGGLPDDDSALAILSRLGSAWRKSADRIRRKFLARDGRLYNERLSEERCKQDEWSRKSKQGGDKSAETRWSANGKGGYQMVNVSPPPNGNSSSSSSSSSSKAAYAASASQPESDVHEVTERLLKAHAEAGFIPGKLLDTAHEIGVKLVGSVNPEAILQSLVPAHALFVPHWQIRKREKAGAYVPDIAKWIRDGEYKFPPAPPPANRTTPQKVYDPSKELP